MRHRGKEIAPAGASVTGRRWLEQRGGARDPTGLAHLRDEETFELLRLPGVGLFMLPASAARTPAGLELSWVTE